MNLIALILFAVVPLQVGNSEFMVTVDGERIGTEEFAIAQNGDGFVARGRTRLNFDGQRIDVQSRMELDEFLNPIDYEYRSGEQVLHVEIADQVAVITFSIDGQKTSQDVRFPSGGMIVDDNFFHHYLLLLYRIHESGGTIPVFVPQQMTVGPLEIKPLGNRTYQLSSENLRLFATTDEDGRLLRLASEDASIVVER